VLLNQHLVGGLSRRSAEQVVSGPCQFSCVRHQAEPPEQARIVEAGESFLCIVSARSEQATHKLHRLAIGIFHYSIARLRAPVDAASLVAEPCDVSGPHRKALIIPPLGKDALAVE
jgi:hypothetical protein